MSYALVERGIIPRLNILPVLLHRFCTGPFMTSDIIYDIYKNPLRRKMNLISIKKATQSTDKISKPVENPYLS